MPRRRAPRRAERSILAFNEPEPAKLNLRLIWLALLAKERLPKLQGKEAVAYGVSVSK